MALGAASRDAILGSVGRKRLCFALSDGDGRVRPGTIRTYPAQAATGVTAALIGYQRDLALPTLPTRSAIAVSGLVRGDAIAITQSRWFLSRSGLKAMLGEPPLILNDFAAEAWGLCSAALSVQEVFGGTAAPTLQKPGTYLVLGITSGLGVAVVHRNAAGAVTVLATEAGHGAFAAVDDELTALAADLSAGRRPVFAEEVLCASGLVAIYALLARRSGSKTALAKPEDVTRAVSSNPVARAACDMLAKAFWAQAGSLAMTFGAWDGVLVIGALANAIRPSLRLPAAQALFSVSTQYRRVLLDVPRALVTLENGELIGMAEALRHG